VKNVAGFDLTRLLIGSWGTLGVITEVSLRLRAQPEVDETIAIELPASDEAIRDVLARITTAPIAPFALELVNDALARRLELGEGPLLLARLGGNAELVNAQRSVLATYGEMKSDVDAGAWRAIRECDTGSTLVMRISRRRSHMATTWRYACELAQLFRGFVHASPGRGVARIVLPSFTGSTNPSAGIDLFDGTVIYERLPPALWPLLTRRHSAHPLAATVRAAFDPDRILNPGILGELVA
jgi:glycolate oxidase FAD binding subunit